MHTLQRHRGRMTERPFHPRRPCVERRDDCGLVMVPTSRSAMMDRLDALITAHAHTPTQCRLRSHLGAVREQLEQTLTDDFPG